MLMKILLMDLDIVKQRRPFPNLALMKLSAYYKNRGDEVFLNFPLGHPDMTYASCVFTWHRSMRSSVPTGAVFGGSGIDLKVELPPEVEDMMPDYSLYPKVGDKLKDCSIGFTSRGCPRKCPPCIVPLKEGPIKAVARIYQFWNKLHRKICLLDNNLLAAPNWRQTLEDILAEDLKVDCNQGLDIRLVNEENVSYLKQMRLIDSLRFSFDDMAYESALRRGIELLLDAGLNSRRLLVYVLYGFDGDETAIERLNILCSYNVNVYPMGYRGVDGKEPTRQLLYHDTQLWHGPRGNINKFLRLVGRLHE